MPRRGASQVFSVRPAPERLDPAKLEEIDGIPVIAVLRSRRETGALMVALADGRYAVSGGGVLAIGGRRALAGWCERRADREGVDDAERSWWQEVTGALIARGHP
jgi:hypothetical protein